MIDGVRMISLNSSSITAEFRLGDRERGKSRGGEPRAVDDRREIVDGW